MTPIQRFIAKCKHNACTDCVEWIGAKTRGQGHTSWYGSFWFEGKSWLAHRWAAKYIHGLHLAPGLQVDHKCRNTLCVEHLQVVPAQVNRELQWIRVQVGLDEPWPSYAPDPESIPFYIEPDWMIHERSSSTDTYPAQTGSTRCVGLS